MRSVCRAFLVWAVAVPAMAQDVISFNFAQSSGGSSGSSNLLAAADVAGAGSFAAANWNNLLTDWSGNAGALPATITYNDGTAVSGLSINYDGPNCWNNGIGTDTADKTMMRNYMDSNNSDSPYVKLSGIPYPKYLLVVYADGDQNTGGPDGPYVIRAGVNTTQQGAQSEAGKNMYAAITPAVYLLEPGQFSGAYAEVPVTSTTIAGAASGNYIVFSNLNGRIIIDPTQTPASPTQTRSPLNGFQIVRDTSWALSSAGAGATTKLSPNAIETISANLDIARLYTSRDFKIDTAATVRLMEGDLEIGNANQWIQAPSGGGVGGKITSGNGTLTIRQLDPDLTDVQIKAVLCDDGANPVQMIKEGYGMVALGALNTYSGGTVINGGTLYSYVSGNDTQSALPPGRPVTIGAGATLRMGSQNDGLGWFGGNPSVITNRGTFTANGGYHHSVGRFVLDGGTISSVAAGDGTGNYIFDGQIDVIGNAASTISAHTIQLRGGAGNTGIVFNVANGAAPVDLVVTSRLAGTSLTKTGEGTLSLDGPMTYGGATTVAGGELKVNGAYTGGGLTTVKELAWLTGTGSVQAVTVEDSGAVAPGNSMGTLTIAGNFTLAPTSMLNYELNGPDLVGGVTGDFITGVQDLTLDGILNVVSLGFDFSTASVGDRWKIISFSGSLTDNGLTPGDIPYPGDGKSYDVVADSGSVYLEVVPEPSTLGLLALAGLAAVLRRRSAGR